MANFSSGLGITLGLRAGDAKPSILIGPEVPLSKHLTMTQVGSEVVAPMEKFGVFRLVPVRVRVVHEPAAVVQAAATVADAAPTSPPAQPAAPKQGRKGAKTDKPV